MNTKRNERKKSSNLKNINALVPKNINLNKFKINPVDVLEGTKNKIGNFYNNFKKEREKEKRRLEKKKLLDEKKELIRQKKQAQKER